MSNLSTIYSKTGKGLRARTFLLGGLSASLMKVLSLIDGKSKAEVILLKFNDISEQQLITALNQLENDGYIKPATIVPVDEWALTSNFTPMVVEEFQHVEEIEAQVLAKAETAAKHEADKVAKAEQEAAEKIEIITAKLKQKAKAEADQLQAQTLAKAQEESRLQAELVRLAAAQQAKTDADVKARIEAERSAHELALAQKQAAEALANIAAQAQQQAINTALERAAELARLNAIALEKAQLEAQKNARLEIKRIFNQAEEDRKKSEAQAKEARLEAKRKAKAEQDARLKAERKLREEAKQARAKAITDEKARLAAKESERLEMARIEREAVVAREKAKIIALNKLQEAQQALENKAKAYEQARLNIEAKAIQEAEQIRARAEAAETANFAARENGRLEMERIGREADAERRKSAALPITSSQAEPPAIAPQFSGEIDENDNKQSHWFEEDDLEKDDFKNDAIDYNDTEDSAGDETSKKTLKQAEEEARDEFKHVAKQQAEANAIIHASIKPPHNNKFIAVLAKLLLIYLPLAILLLIGVLHFINLSMLVAPIEKIASNSVGEPVTIAQVRISIWPTPHLVLKNITVGAITIESAVLAPINLRLFNDVKMFKSLQFEGLKIELDNAEKPLLLINNLAKDKHLKIEQISFKKLNVGIHDLALGAFEGKIDYDEKHALKNIDLLSNDSSLSLQILPQDSHFNILLNATKWALPVSPKMVFDTFKAKGTLSQDRLNFSQIDAEIYGGNLTAKGFVDWSSAWSAVGNFNFAGVNTLQILKALDSHTSINGKLNLIGHFTSTATMAANLANITDLTASFELRDGQLTGIELSRAILVKGGQSLKGDATQFNKLTGTLLLNNGHYQYKQLALVAPQFRASGNVDILPNQDIAGKISADLVAQSRRLHANFSLAGKVDDVKRQ